VNIANINPFANSNKINNTNSGNLILLNKMDGRKSAAASFSGGSNLNDINVINNKKTHGFQ
jgi:hypothetical protein